MGFVQSSGFGNGDHLNILGLVLAGGKSRRFGEDKALALYDGKGFLERAVDLLREVGLKPAVVTRHGADYSFLRCPVLRDKLPEKGPLGGIYTAMKIFGDTHFLVLTCDMPALNVSALTQLLEPRQPVDITVFSHHSTLQPFPAVYSASLFASVRRRLFQERLSMTGLLEETVNKRILSWEGDPEIFLNVNHREDILPGARISN